MERTEKKSRRKYDTIEEAVEAQRGQILKAMKKWHSSKEGRANNLSNAYKQYDKRYLKLGLETVTPQWIMNNIFTSKCYWCGEDNWRELGCDRIHNFKPHSTDNVVCCCRKCNIERGAHSFDWFTKYQRSKKNAPKQLTLF